jgi:hypothetical protein
MPVRNPAWLIVLPTAVCLADIGLTLHGQPGTYWGGDYASVIEGNPLPRFFLERHPAAFLVLALAWLACFWTVILLAARRWALFVCAAVVLGHTIGATSWLLRNRALGPWFAAAFLLTIVILALPTWRSWRRASETARI